MHPVKMMMESKLEVHKDKTLREATEMAYKVCWLNGFLLHMGFQQYNSSRQCVPAANYRLLNSEVPLKLLPKGLLNQGFILQPLYSTTVL